MRSRASLPSSASRRVVHHRARLGQAAWHRFRHFLSVGDSADVDFGDIIDYSRQRSADARHPAYIESVKNARKFMSAARARPVTSDRGGEIRPQRARRAGRRLAIPARCGRRRCLHRGAEPPGILRVDGVEELFDTVETLARSRRMPGRTTGDCYQRRRPGVMAVDSLIEYGGTLADLSPETMTASMRHCLALVARIRSTSSASPQRPYADAVKIVLADPGVDAVR